MKADDIRQIAKMHIRHNPYFPDAKVIAGLLRQLANIKEAIKQGKTVYVAKNFKMDPCSKDYEKKCSDRQHKECGCQKARLIILTSEN